MQANWIGKSVGVRFAFTHDIRDDAGTLIGDGRMYVFTTRADTIMGVTFCAVAAEHPLAAHAAKSNPALAAFIDECRRGSVIEADMATMEKKGMPTGLYVAHPITGEKIEVWVGNYVLMAYGDGAVMGVPAHDERDFEFAKKYGLPIKQVIAVPDEEFSTDAWQPWYADKERGRCVFSGKYDGLALRRGRRRRRRRPRRQGPGREEDHVPPARLGHLAPALLGHADPDHPLRRVRRRARAGARPAGRAARGLRAGRQRQSAQQARRLPRRRVPEVRQAGAARDGHDGHVRRFVVVLHALHVARAPTTMVDARNDYWMPMDQYIGGIEHAILHLLYARFWTKVMRDMGLVKIDEPFTRLFTQGMLLNHIYFRRNAKGGKDYFPPDERHADDRRRRATSPADDWPTAARRVRRRRQDGQDRAERRRAAGPDRQVRRGHRAAVRDVRRLARTTPRSGPTPASKARTAS